MIDIKIETCSSFPCEPEIFTINGINVDINDFGVNEDIHPEIAAPYCCGCHRFVGYIRPKNMDVLTKYNIDVFDFYEIVNKLEGILDIGPCYWCS